MTTDTVSPVVVNDTASITLNSATQATGDVLTNDVDGDGEQDQRGSVVDEALGAQHGDGSARQSFRQACHGGGVGGGEHGTEDRRRV